MAASVRDDESGARDSSRAAGSSESIHSAARFCGGRLACRSVGATGNCRNRDDASERDECERSFHVLTLSLDGSVGVRGQLHRGCPACGLHGGWIGTRGRNIV